MRVRRPAPIGPVTSPSIPWTVASQRTRSAVSGCTGSPRSVCAATTPDSSTCTCSTASLRVDADRHASPWARYDSQIRTSAAARRRGSDSAESSSTGGSAAAIACSATGSSSIGIRARTVANPSASTPRYSSHISSPVAGSATATTVARMIRSSCAAVAVRASSTSPASLSGVATRTSARTFENDSSPRPKVAAITGNRDSACATRTRSLAAVSVSEHRHDNQCAIDRHPSHCAHADRRSSSATTNKNRHVACATCAANVTTSCSSTSVEHDRIEPSPMQQS